jgi:hypothetical protein
VIKIITKTSAIKININVIRTSAIKISTRIIAKTMARIIVKTMARIRESVTMETTKVRAEIARAKTIEITTIAQITNLYNLSLAT